MTDIAKKSRNPFTAFLCKVMLISAFMNTALRSGPEASLTAFRILAVLTIPFLLLRFFRLFVKEVFLLIGLLILALLQYSAFAITSLHELTVSYLHIIFIFAVYICVKILSKLEAENFSENMYRFLDRFTVFTIILTLIEYIFSISIFPATQVRSCPTAFFWNENELCCALFLMLPLYFMSWKQEKSIFTAAKMLAIIYFIYAFDCKILMLSTLLMFFLYIVLMNEKMLKNYQLLLLISLIVIGAAIILFCYIDFSIPSGNDYDVKPTFGTAVREPVMQILRLERFYSAGSIHDRSDAIIIGLQNLVNTHGIGIGLGGSLHIIDGELVTAKSMHNITVQTIVEIGVIALIVYLIFIFKLYCTVTKIAWFKLCFFLILPLSSSISSVGIMSNYMFWGIVFFVFSMQIPHWENIKTEPQQVKLEN